MKLTQFLHKRISTLLCAGMQEEPYPAIQEKLFLAFLFNCLAILVMLVFITESMLKGDFLHGLYVLTLTVLAIINIIVLHFSGREILFYNRSVWRMAIICMYLLSTGGVDNTGPLWCYVSPLLALYLQGTRQEVISLLLMMFYSLIVFFIPDNPLALVEYSSAFKTRFIASIFTVTAL